MDDTGGLFQGVGISDLEYYYGGDSKDWERRVRAVKDVKILSFS